MKAVARQPILAPYETKAGAGHDQMEVPEPPADRAVAAVHLDRGGGPDLEFHLPAMAAPLVPDQPGFRAATRHLVPRLPAPRPRGLSPQAREEIVHIRVKLLRVHRPGDAEQR